MAEKAPALAVAKGRAKIPVPMEVPTIKRVLFKILLMGIGASLDFVKINLFSYLKDPKK